MDSIGAGIIAGTTGYRRATEAFSETATLEAYLKFERALAEVVPVHVGDLQLPPLRGCQPGGDVHHVRAVGVEPGDGEVGARPSRLFLNVECTPVCAQFDDAVALRVASRVGEDGGALGPARRTP